MTLVSMVSEVEATPAALNVLRRGMARERMEKKHTVKYHGKNLLPKYHVFRHIDMAGLMTTVSEVEATPAFWNAGETRNEEWESKTIREETKEKKGKKSSSKKSTTQFYLVIFFRTFDFFCCSLLSLMSNEAA
jgi:hypothetical protein